MKTLIICKLAEVFIIPQITTEKGNRLKFTKGTTEVELDAENVEKLETFAKNYGDYIKIVTGEETEKLDSEKIVDNMNKETKLQEKKAKLFGLLEEFKDERIKKKEIVEAFKDYISDEKASKEELIKQIEENIEKIEE